MTTYSLAVTGYRADSAVGPKDIDVPDSYIGSGFTLASATTGGMQGCMRTGQQVLCQMPDGSQRWATFDDRSTVSNPIMKFVGP